MSPSRRVCCCIKRPCWVGFRDNFNRTTLGSDWDVLSGSWGTDSTSYLECVSEGVLITTQRQPAPSRSGANYTLRITIDLIDFPAADTGTQSWKIICGFVDVSNFDWIELTYDSSTYQMFPTFWRRTGGSDAKVMNPTDFPGSDPWSIAPELASATFVICYASAQWTVQRQGSEIYWEVCGGGKAALPANTSHGLIGFLGETGVLFDNLIYEEHWESTLLCSYCTCFCLNQNDDDDYSCLPDELTLTITRTAGLACSDIDGKVLTMYQSNPNVDGASPVFDATAWKYQWFSDTFYYESAKVWFVLQCNGNDYRLNVLNYPGTSVTGTSSEGLYFETGAPWEANADWDISTCDPVLLVYHGLQTFVTECDLDPGPGSGERPAACPSAVCVPTLAEEDRPIWDCTVTV